MLKACVVSIYFNSVLNSERSLMFALGCVIASVGIIGDGGNKAWCLLWY